MDKARTKWFHTPSSSNGSAQVARQRLKNDLRHAPRTLARQCPPRQATKEPTPSEQSMAQSDLLHALLSREVGA
jgi:hypothetical protein